MFIPKAVGQMETTYYFDVINDSLTCKIRYLDSAALRPIGPFTVKQDGWITIKFHSNYKGFKLYAGCVKNIAFIRIDN